MNPVLLRLFSTDFCIFFETVFSIFGMIFGEHKDYRASRTYRNFRTEHSLLIASIISRTIDHAVCTFNLPTEFKASGQEHILDEDDKVKIKVDPLKTSLDGITTAQLEEIVDGWMKFITKAFRDTREKVSYGNRDDEELCNSLKVFRLKFQQVFVLQMRQFCYKC